jgi:epoxyqueuosine reductase
MHKRTGLRAYDEIVQAATVKQLARECGFELAGVAAAAPLTDDIAHYQAWINAGMAGKMSYLADHRADVRRDPRNLLASARSVICVGKLYNTPASDSADDTALIAKYARGRDYHDVLRERLEELARRIYAEEAHEWRVCVDTAPLLERSYAREAGLGWIGRNQCLINEPQGSWFVLGELLTSLAIAPDTPPPDRCGTCSRCIDACPTQAILPNAAGEWTLDARRCIAYLNIELHGAIPEELRQAMGANVYGCDICQDVCPWNRRAPETSDPAFLEDFGASPALESLAYLTAEEFRARYRHTPVTRPKYDGFLRNVAVAMGASGEERYRQPLEHLARHASALVAEHAQWALRQLKLEHLVAENVEIEQRKACVEAPHS